MSANDLLADQLAKAAERLGNEHDRRFARSLLAQHTSGKELSAKQMSWAKVLIKRAGLEDVETGFAKVETDIFAPNEEPTSPIAHAISPETHDLIVRGQIIEAIKSHRALYGLDLRTAKDEVEAERARLQDDGRTAVPERDMLNAQNEDKLERIITRVASTHIAKLGEQLTDLNEQRERNLAARQEAFNSNAAKSIAQACVKEALRQLDARVPRQTIITVQRANGDQHTIEGTQHPNFEKLLRAATTRLPNGYAPGIMLAGEAGSGKTYGTNQLARALDLPWHFNGAISFPHEMLGFIDAGGKYHTTPFRQAYEHGGIYTFDEVDRSDPVALLSVNPHLADGLATFPDAQVKRHPDCIIVATANTWGYGNDAKYSGATKLDAAFLSRFPVRLAWDVDEQMEAKLVGSGAWLDKFRHARNLARASGLQVSIDTRQALAGKALIESGYSLDEAASMTYLASLKPEQRRIIEGAL